MNFKEYWQSLDEEYLIESSEDTIAKNTWNAAKEEILKIIFLNTKVNGEHKANIEEIIKQIEKL